ncbi:unnamed protein product [Ilex paraguariensis]|uniref:WPP domain-containing protein n=1 Tax=Ilex paraguariensis TaxID=185542 RepID=A0ABC8SFD9_9AQUA
MNMGFNKSIGSGRSLAISPFSSNTIDIFPNTQLFPLACCTAQTPTQRPPQILFSIWPPSQRTHNAVINRLIETLSTQSVLSKRYDTLSHEEASKATKNIEEEAFAAAGALASNEETMASRCYRCTLRRSAWNLAVSEPKKVIHCIKVGMALSFVSLFYYMRPLYKGVGGSVMWAVMIVVVAFEHIVGATLCKCVNRATITFLDGSLGIGVHWVASHLVSVSGCRVDKLFELAHYRVSTIAIGTSICITVTMFLCPAWAGEELHSLIIRNLEKLADSLDGCIVEYFKDDRIVDVTEEDKGQKLQGYKCVLNSKATEESMVHC